MTDDLMSAVATAIDAEVYRQYQTGEDWEEAKDVLECLDYCMIAAVAMRALTAWEARQQVTNPRQTDSETESL